MFTALESLVPFLCKPLSRFTMALYCMYLLKASCHGHEVPPFWHSGALHPLLPDINDYTNYTTKENFALTGSYSFIPLYYLSHIFWERTDTRCAVFLVIAMAVTEYPEIPCQAHSTQKGGKISPQIQEECLSSSFPFFWLEQGIIEKSIKVWHRNVNFDSGPICT